MGGDEIQIPIIVIKKSAGDALIKQLTNERKEVKESLVLSFKNPIRKAKHVDLHIIASASDTQVYQFMSEFNNMADSFGELLKTNLTFYYSECMGCTSESQKKYCMRGNAKYCQITSKNIPFLLSISDKFSCPRS